MDPYPSIHDQEPLTRAPPTLPKPRKPKTRKKYRAQPSAETHPPAARPASTDSRAGTNAIGLLQQPKTVIIITAFREVEKTSAEGAPPPGWVQPLWDQPVVCPRPELAQANNGQKTCQTADQKRIHANQFQSEFSPMNQKTTRNDLIRGILTRNDPKSPETG